MLEIKIEESEFLHKLHGMDIDSLKQVLELFGGRHQLITDLVKYFKTEPTKLENDKIKEVFIEILFDCSSDTTYVKDWDHLWARIESLPLGFLIEALETYPPGRHCDNNSDVALNYIMWHRYGTNTLNSKIYEELKDLFDGEPEDFAKFKLKQHYIDELLLFNDIDFLNNNYTDVSFETKEILDLLKQVVIGRKLDTPGKLFQFLSLVDWYAPKNSFDRKYKDTFVLELFESDDGSGEDMWSETSVELWREHFYGIDFDWSCSEAITDQIKDSIQRESNHISKMLEINPNYRHD